MLINYIIYNKQFLLGKTLRPPETPVREVKRKKLTTEEPFEDVSEKTVAQIVATVDDPNYMTGPDVSVGL